jgi:hypothetical protein
MDGENNIDPAEILAGMKRNRDWNNSNGQINQGVFLESLAEAEAQVTNESMNGEGAEGEEAPAPPLPGPSRAALANLSEDQWNKLTDVWCRLIHIDVEKDHGTNYNTDTVNSFLPYDKYKSNFFNNDASGQLISRDFHGVMDKDGIFNAVVDTSIETINKINCNDEERTITIKITNEQYNYKCFDISGAENQERSNILASTIQQFIGPHTFSAFIDTSNKTEKLIGALPSNILNIVYAYTSAVENDAAGKMNKTSVKGGSFKPENYNEFIRKFYLEKAPESKKGMKAITYPPFSNNTRSLGLSHVMCKYPITLELHHGTNFKDGKLNVALTYIKDTGKTVRILENENIATKVRKTLKTVFRIQLSNKEKEKIFISKYHGDIGQVLELYRDIELVNNTDTKNTSDMKACFVSIDLNAILKAFTEGIDLVFYYINASDKLIVFKNINLNDPRVILANFQNQVRALHTQVKAELEEYNKNIHSINEVKGKFDNKVEEILQGLPTGATPREKYIHAIEKGVQVATLIPFVPKEELSQLMVEDIGDISNVYEAKKKLQELYAKRNEMKIPAEYTKLNVMNEEELAETKLANELIISATGNRTSFTCVAGNIWNTINFSKLPLISDANSGEEGAGALPNQAGPPQNVRLATKLQTFLAIDVVLFIYNRLQNYDVHEKFISFIKKAFDSGSEEEKYFSSVLNITRMKATTGGSRYSGGTRMKNRKTKQKTLKVSHKIQSGGATEQEILNKELEEIETLLKYYEDFKDKDTTEYTKAYIEKVFEFTFEPEEVIGEAEAEAANTLSLSLQASLPVAQGSQSAPLSLGLTNEPVAEEDPAFFSTFPHIRIIYELLTVYGENADETVKGVVDRLIERLLKLLPEDDKEQEKESVSPSTPTRQGTKGRDVGASGASGESRESGQSGQSGSTVSAARTAESPPAQSRSGSPKPETLLSPEKRRGGAKTLKKSKKQQNQRKSKYQSRTAKHKH